MDLCFRTTVSLNIIGDTSCKKGKPKFWDLFRRRSWPSFKRISLDPTAYHRTSKYQTVGLLIWTGWIQVSEDFPLHSTRPEAPLTRTKWICQLATVHICHLPFKKAKAKLRKPVGFLLPVNWGSLFLNPPYNINIAGFKRNFAVLGITIANYIQHSARWYVFVFNITVH